MISVGILPLSARKAMKKYRTFLIFLFLFFLRIVHSFDSVITIIEGWPSRDYFLKNWGKFLFSDVFFQIIS